MIWEVVKLIQFPSFCQMQSSHLLQFKTSIFLLKFYFIIDPLICSICSLLSEIFNKNLTHLPLLKFDIFKFLTRMLNVGSNKIIKGICFNCSSKASYSFIFSKLRTYFSKFPRNSRQDREMRILQTAQKYHSGFTIHPKSFFQIKLRILVIFPFLQNII